MIKSIKYSSYFAIALALCALAIFGAGCKKADPLVGYSVDALFNPDTSSSDKAIQDDYSDYIQKLPPEEKKYARINACYKNSAGGYAAVVEVDLNGTAWYHALFYDKDNKRIKVIKYVGYHYMS